MEEDRSKTFSPSKLDCYKQCPRKYRYRYVDKIKREGQSMEAFLGTCVHGAFEALYESLMHGKRLTLEETLAEYERLWAEGFNEKIKVRPGFSAADWKALGRDCVTYYYEGNKPFEANRTVAVEKKVGFALEVDGQTYRIEGYVDRLALGKDGAFEVHDYKTAKTLPTQEDVDEDVQLAVYDLAVRDAWPDTKDVRLIWHYVRHGKSLTSSRTADQRNALMRELGSLIDKIKHDREFPPVETPLCGWCEYRDLCPLFSHAERTAALPPEKRVADDGVMIVDQLAELDARKHDLRGEIKALDLQAEELEDELARYAKAKGITRVTGTTSEANVTQKETLKLPTRTGSPDAFAELEAGLKALPIWKEVSHLDAHAVVERLKSGEWPVEVRDEVERLLDKCAKTEHETNVRLRKRKDVE